MNTRIPDTPLPPDPPVLLEDHFNDALMGVHVAFDEAPRAAYGLTKLAAIEKTRSLLVDDESARRRVWEMIQDITRAHGGRCPLFIDDAAFAKDEGPKLWTPGGN